MKNRISSALKHFALSVALRGLSQRNPKTEMKAPQPRRQPMQLPSLGGDEAWMFDKHAETAVEHRREMLSNEMNRLSGTLSNLRAFLGNVAVDAPIMASHEISARAAPMIIDRDLFEGETLAATPNAIPAHGEAGYLFEEELTEGQRASSEIRARAA